MIALESGIISGLSARWNLLAVLLLSGRYTPLGLTLLGPVIINILCVHIFLDPIGLPMAIIVAALASFLLYRYREHFVGLINPALSAPSRSATTGDAKS